MQECPLSQVEQGVLTFDYSETEKISVADFLRRELSILENPSSLIIVRVNGMIVHDHENTYISHLDQIQLIPNFSGGK